MGRYDEDDDREDLRVYDDRADDVAEEEADDGHGADSWSGFESEPEPEDD